MIRLLLLAACCLLMAHPAKAGAEWRFDWVQDPVSGEYACSAASDPRFVRTGTAGRETAVVLGVQADGALLLMSETAPFAPNSPSGVEFVVGDARFSLQPRSLNQGRALVFSEEDSIALHRQFEDADAVTMELRFAPQQDVTEHVRFSLAGYRDAAARYKGCRGLLLSPGWMGLFMTNASRDPSWMSWVEKNTTYRTPGIVIVTVDPRKEASRSDLRPGDRILGANGEPAEVGALIRSMKELEAGKTIALDVVRDGVQFRKIVARPRDRDSEGIAEPAPKTKRGRR